jgi:4-amino-4-deoxy-L-arabinose transferase-like glycosyltransferase
MSTKEKIFLFVLLIVIIFRLISLFYSTPYYYPDSWAYLSTVFKINTAWNAVTWIAPFLGVLSIVFTYLLTKELFNKKIAMIAALLMSLEWHYWWYSSQFLSDGPVVSFFIGSLYFFIIAQRRPVFYVPAAIFAGFSFLTKYWGLVLLPIFFVYLVYKYKFQWLKNNYMWIGVLFFVLVLSPWLIYNQVNFNSFFYPVIRQMTEGSVGTVSFQGFDGGLLRSMLVSFSGVFFYFLTIPYYISVPGALFFLFGFWLLLKKKFSGNSIILLLVFVFVNLMLILQSQEVVRIYALGSMFSFFMHSMYIEGCDGCDYCITEKDYDGVVLYDGLFRIYEM